MVILTALLIGLVAGTLATYISRGTGFGIVGNTVVGILGALVGGWGFRTLDVDSPLEGAAGVVLVAFVGASALLFVIHLVTRRGDR
jgi:uncharacterized membrane protein YeaQ/YmgE (transglycosylase-associated protein family)